MFGRSKQTTSNDGGVLTLPPTDMLYGKIEKKGKVTIKRDRAGYYRWRLSSTNGKILADSGQGYKRKRDCRNAVDIIGKSIRNANIVETE